MEKGKIIITKSNKGRLIVSLERPGKAAMPLSYVTLPEVYNGKDCKYKMEGGKVTYIEIEGKAVYPQGSSTSQSNNNTSAVGATTKGNFNTYPDSLSFKDVILPFKSFDEPMLKDLSNTGVDNFYLKFYKLPRFEMDDFKPEKKNQRKFLFYKKKFRDNPFYKIRAYYGDLDFKTLAKRQQQQVKVLSPNENHSLVFEAKASSAFIHGLGIESVYEASINLHHIYGCPFIASSSIKGILRSFVLESLYLAEQKFSKQAWERAEEEASKDPDFVEIFGNTEHKGQIIFFEALPTTPPEFDMDIMNPHYPNYYTGSMESTDTQSPVPILFPVVKAGTKFQFACIGLKKPLYQYTIKGYKLEKLFKAALQYQGVGAKTSLGYGSFEV